MADAVFQKQGIAVISKTKPFNWHYGDNYNHYLRQYLRGFVYQEILCVQGHAVLFV